MRVMRFPGLVMLAAIIFGSTVAQGQQSYRTQQSMHPNADSAASQPAPAGPSGHPTRFLGWRQAVKQGPETVQHFQNLARRTANLPRPSGGISTAPFGGGERNAAKTSAAQASSAGLPGIALRPSLPAGAIPSAIASGDFNGDGKADWIVANAGDNSLDLYLGNGDGTSQLPVIIPLLGQSPVDIAVADLNGDKNLDVVVAEADSNTVGIFFGKGDGTFGAEIEIAIANAQPLAVAVADLNHDGRPDLLVGVVGDFVHVNSNFGVMLNTGAGHFAAPVYAPNPQVNERVAGDGFSVADVNGDGIPDVFVTGFNTEVTTGQLFFGNGDGTFSGGAILASSVDSELFSADLGQAVLADVNGDGCPDLTIGNSIAEVWLFFNDCKGNFPVLQSRIYGVGDAAQSLAIVDVNGDGKPDIVTGGISLGLEPGSPIGYSTGNTLSVLLNDGTGNFSPVQIYRGDPGMFGLVAADLKSDGFPDIITANQDANSVTVFANDGTGAFGQPFGTYEGYQTGPVGFIAQAPNSALVGVDLNGDGKPDMALLELTQLGSFNSMGPLAVMLNQGGGRFSAPIRSPMINGQNLQIGDFLFADFRNTGKPDFLAELLIGSSGAPELIYAPNLGAGQFGSPVEIPFATSGMDLNGFAALGVGDFNKDGKLDFAVASFTGATGVTQQLDVYLGKGDGTFTHAFETNFGGSSGSLFPLAVFVGDANQDGKLDIFAWIGTNEVPGSGNDLFEFLGNGDGTFKAATDVVQHIDGMTMADLNHDGILDIISLNGITNTTGVSVAQAQIYLGQPNGTFSIPTAYSPYAGFLQNQHGNNVALDSSRSLAPYVGDFNGDGNLDIAVFQRSTLNDGPAWVQFLAGNGDGTFTPTFNVSQLGIRSIPDFTVPNLLGDGRSSFVQAPNFSSSFQVMPSEIATPFQISPLETPVIGGQDKLEIILDVPSSSDTTVSLTASDPNVILPASATVPAGQTSLEVPFTLSSSIAPDRWFSVAAKLGAVTQTAYDFPGRKGVDSFLLDVSPPPLTTDQQGAPSEVWSAGVQSIGDAAGVFQISCSGLPAGASCQFQGISTVSVPGGGFQNVLFDILTTLATPTGTYAFSITATDGVSTLTSPGQLQVTAAPSQLAINPASLTFSPTLDGSTSPAQTITITNTTNSPVSPFVIGPPANNSPSVGNFQNVSACGAAIAANSSCTVQVTFAASQPGTVTDFISFGGSAGFVQVPLAATAADIAIQSASGGSTSATIVAGQFAVFNLQVSPSLFQGTVSMSCTAAIAHGTCSVPGSVTVSGNAPVPFQVTVTTSAATSAIIGLPRLGNVPKRRFATVVTLLVVITSLALVVGIRSDSRKMTRVFLLFLFCCAAVGMSDCGGGGGSAGGGGGTGAGGGGSTATPAGVYMVTITATAGNATRTIPLSVTVTAN
jgi:hypothetical protein